MSPLKWPGARAGLPAAGTFFPGAPQKPGDFPIPRGSQCVCRDEITKKLGTPRRGLKWGTPASDMLNSSLISPERTGGPRALGLVSIEDKHLALNET